ncbi:MAG TPA: undecaprenyl-diphosphate phosphatase [Candidatus Butyricicoccus avistercoris]|uniref:Undecaprenyl-diphosphatase n=1 Tax=Candidatus Butyricicoccus avistercoris TaxID=2838518 RepID=A0A9D1PHM9_9FIRM|nr:undecaprenyl-diphosphate phosphatase [Candidatus Butyricicoccus avistercoris]
MIEILKAIFLGIVEGITEWLPVSSTGHMILVDEFLQLKASEAFKELFFVVIQFGAILAVLTIYFKRFIPLKKNSRGQTVVDNNVFRLWLKIIIACIPAAVIGILFDDIFTALFYNFQTVGLALIIFGVAFILVENQNEGKRTRVQTVNDISYKDAFIIGLFQLIAAVFPGTSRSGATILGSIAIGISRAAAAEFTFFLAVPVMFGASLLKFFKLGFAYSAFEWVILAIGTVTAYIISILAIKFLMGYVKKHDFKVFGWYRIVLGGIVMAYWVFTVLFS